MTARKKTNNKNTPAESEEDNIVAGEDTWTKTRSIILSINNACVMDSKGEYNPSRDRHASIITTIMHDNKVDLDNMIESVNVSAPQRTSKYSTIKVDAEVLFLKNLLTFLLSSGPLDSKSIDGVTDLLLGEVTYNPSNPCDPYENAFYAKASVAERLLSNMDGPEKTYKEKELLALSAYKVAKHLYDEGGLFGYPKTTSKEDVKNQKLYLNNLMSRAALKLHEPDKLIVSLSARVKHISDLIKSQNKI